MLNIIEDGSRDRPYQIALEGNQPLSKLSQVDAKEVLIALQNKVDFSGHEADRKVGKPFFFQVFDLVTQSNILFTTQWEDSKEMGSIKQLNRKKEFAGVTTLLGEASKAIKVKRPIT